MKSEDEDIREKDAKEMQDEEKGDNPVVWKHNNMMIVTLMFGCLP